MNASAPFATRKRRSASANAAVAASSQGDGSVRRAAQPERREHRRCEQRDVGRPDRDLVPAAPTSKLGQVARAEQAQDDGDEKDGEGEIPRRPPQHS